MKISVILGHPNPASFNHALYETVAEALAGAGHKVFLHDLYAEGFDPVIKGVELAADMTSDALAARYCSELKESDGLVIVHPNWWGQPPAILKGWIDRVLRPGVAYRFDDGDTGGGVPQGLLGSKKALVLNTSNTPEERESSVFGDPLELIWKNCVFCFCAMDQRSFLRKTFRVIADSKPEQRKQWLEEAAAIARSHFAQAAESGSKEKLE